MSEAPILKVEILGFIDESAPGWVECRLIDASGREHLFREKVPVVTTMDIWSDSKFPQEGKIACEILSDPHEETVVIDTAMPWGVESTAGQTQLEVNRCQLSGNLGLD